MSPTCSTKNSFSFFTPANQNSKPEASSRYWDRRNNAVAQKILSTASPEVKAQHAKRHAEHISSQ